MDEFKIWEIDNRGGAGVTPLHGARQTESEGLLEDIVTRSPDMLDDGLQLVGRQTDTAGGPLDLLGVDRHGRLVVYELKRGTLNRDAVAQVIDYASYLDAMDQVLLCRHIAERSGTLGIQKIEDFGEWYGVSFPDQDSPTPPRMVLVGLGVDPTTERMVNYLAAGGTDISLLTFHGFEQGTKTLLARRVEVDSSKPKRAGKTGSYDRRRRFDERSQSLGAMELVDAVTEMILSQRASFSSSYSTKRKNFILDYSWYAPNDGSWSPSTAGATLFIEPDESNAGSVLVGFHPVAVALATPSEFSKLEDEGLEQRNVGKSAIFQIGTVDYGVGFPLRSQEEWQTRKEQLAALTRKVCAGYDAARQKASSVAAANRERQASDGTT